jgi:predicted Zn-dependent peptidase
MIKLFTVVLVATSGVFAQNLPAKSVSLASALPNPVAIVRAAVGAQAPATPVNVKSYKEWKNEKVQIAIKKVTITKAQIEYRKLNKQFIQTNEPVAAKDVELDKLEASLKNDLYSLEVARELSVTDYFAIYLTKQDNKTEAYKEAADKMTPDEVNQLIRAYADSMFSTNGHGSPSGKVGPTAMEKSDKPQ